MIKPMLRGVHDVIHNDVIRLDWVFFVLASPVGKAIE